MTTLRPAVHSILGVVIIEVLDDNDTVVGVIYPSDDGIKIVSAHITETEIPEDIACEIIEDDGTSSFPPIPSVSIDFKASPYIISDGRIIKIQTDFPRD